MNGILTKDGYGIIQHEDDKTVMIYKDTKLVKRIKASRYMTERELIDLYDFYKGQTNELEGI